MLENRQLSENYETRVRDLLLKASFFNRRKIEVLVIMLLAVIGGIALSLQRIAKDSPQHFSRRFLTVNLQKYALVQRKVIRLVFRELVEELIRTRKFFLLVDDILITKQGKPIFGTRYWHNYNENRAV